MNIFLFLFKLANEFVFKILKINDLIVWLACGFNLIKLRNNLVKLQKFTGLS